jgi:hypothetical protein
VPSGLRARVLRSDNRTLWSTVEVAARSASPLDRSGRLAVLRGYALVRIGRAERRRGAVAAAARSYRRAAALGGPRGAQARREWAELLSDLGRWGEAAAVLAPNVAASPHDATSRWQLGVVLLERCRWGGTWIGGRDGPPSFWADPEDPSTGSGGAADRLGSAGALLAEAVRRRPDRASWSVRLGEVHELCGALEAAAQRFDAALRSTSARDAGRWVFRAKHPWQFELERVHHRAGRPRVVDPLFDCEVRPRVRRAGGAPGTSPPGSFRIRVNHTGLVVEGMLTARDHSHVELFVDDIRLRRINLGRDVPPAFSQPLQRDTVAHLPTVATFRVRTPTGALLAGPGGAEELELDVPHGDGTLRSILAAGGELDKKGGIPPTAAETHARQQGYLELYGQVSALFERRLGRQLFVVYGTLLGCIREGDFIRGDDDFDAGYVSDASEPEAVKGETLRIVLELVRAGFTVSFNRLGRLCRVQRERTGGHGLHLDLRPLWFADGRVWLHSHASLPSSRADFLPVVECRLRGAVVHVPRRPEVFLEGHYGPGWTVPDPGFAYYPDEVDPRIRERLARALITPAEYHDLAAVVAAEAAQDPTVGRFVSIGSQELYPLEELVG